MCTVSVRGSLGVRDPGHGRSRWARVVGNPDTRRLWLTLSDHKFSLVSLRKYGTVRSTPVKGEDPESPSPTPEGTVKSWGARALVHRVKEGPSRFPSGPTVGPEVGVEDVTEVLHLGGPDRRPTTSPSPTRRV